VREHGRKGQAKMSESTVAGCVFCGIAAGGIPARVVYEDDVVVAFDDLYPQAPSHTLLIPRIHVASVDELGPEDEGLAGRLLLAAAEVARRKGLDRGGYRIVANTGEYGGQTVFHLHLHLLGGRHLTWPPG
jgi:histidine triad (HIT) family protein